MPPVPTTVPTSEPVPTKPGEQVTCYDLTSHGASAANDTTPFMIPTGETYHCFYFDVPWPASSVAAAFRSKLDNTKGLHHWFLYAMPTAHANGSTETCLPLHIDGPQMLAGWSPGGKDITLPADVGAEIPAPMTTLMVEWHYLNSTTAPLADRSSVSVCTVPIGSRPKLASTTWVGTENIYIPAQAQASASGVCKPGRKGMAAGDPIQLLYAAPHMHQFGRHFSIELDRADGSKVSVMDQGFDVGNQAMVETPFQVLAGDTLKTTCMFQNTSSAAVAYGGPFSGGEKCYGFVVHYPAHALDNGTRSLLGASNSCL
jgi:dopamine beta-monooxygenase